MEHISKKIGKVDWQYMHVERDILNIFEQYYAKMNL